MSRDPKKCPVTHLTTEAECPCGGQSEAVYDGRCTWTFTCQDLWLNEKLANFVREVIPEAWYCMPKVQVLWVPLP